ncbi:hypothetical protein GCM10022252_07020 [Streptosporangium oxazolinicum]|uniref:Uncharacterized protein n=1 Tax=Streptosporangium oxazolinicum TaxID=909287 RepID=A0ABP8ACX7_9ACTN
MSPRSPALADFADTREAGEPGEVESGELGATEDAGRDAGTFSSSSSEGLAVTTGMSETGAAFASGSVALSGVPSGVGSVSWFATGSGVTSARGGVSALGGGGGSVGVSTAGASTTGIVSPEEGDSGSEDVSGVRGFLSEPSGPGGFAGTFAGTEGESGLLASDTTP